MSATTKHLPTVAPATWQVVGLTDESDTCDCCGRTDLKRVVVMRAGTDGAEVYMGTSCAARLTGRPVATLRAEAARAEAARRNAAAAEAERQRHADEQAAAVAAGFAASPSGLAAFRIARGVVRYQRDPATDRADVAARWPHQLAAFDTYINQHQHKEP